MRAPIDAEKNDVVKVGRTQYHVTSTRNGGVYGHALKHCDESGCSGDEMFLGPKLDRRANNGPDGPPAEAKKLLTGPAELFEAVERRAEQLGIKSAEAWRQAARVWLGD